jgi:diphosphomevalonate decarboxylase
MQQWLADAPANIALIKYMGKQDTATKIPANSSLSYTLNHLRSYVSLERINSRHDFWEPLELPGTLAMQLSKNEQQRFLMHLEFLKTHFNYRGAFVVRSTNNFPSSTGLASSASSFAALTQCAILALCELTQTPVPPLEEQAQLSRQGSGSSCRSFFSPWALWEGDSVKPIPIPYENLLHEVIVVSHLPKDVSSSEAHSRVVTSPQYKTRPQRAQQHLQQLLQAFQAKQWSEVCAICWNEFQDMHTLFLTSAQPFSYMTPQTKELLNELKARWEQNGDGPIITMDAGPNIHLLYRQDQAEQARVFKQDVLIGNYDVL